MRDGKLLRVCAAMHDDDCKQVVVVAGLHHHIKERGRGLPCCNFAPSVEDT